MPEPKFLIAVNVPKAYSFQAYYRGFRADKIWPSRDAELAGLANNYHVSEVARKMKLPLWRVVKRASDLNLSFPTYSETMTPSAREWVAVASEKAREADIEISHVLGGKRYKRASLARWKAWKEILDSNPVYSAKGLADISGFDHTSILHGLTRLNGISAKQIREGHGRSSGRKNPKAIMAGE